MVHEGLDLTQLPAKLHVLDSPPLEEIATVFQKKLRDNFQDVSAEVIDCPDLTKEPYNLAAGGLGGNPVIIELGSPGYLFPVPVREKLYDMSSIPKLVGDEKCFIIGAGSGPWPYVGVCCECMMNVVMDERGTVVPGTRISKIDENGKCVLDLIPASENRCSMLANLFSSRGETDKVVKVHCQNRTGTLDFVAAMRTALTEAFPNKVIGMGGVFVVVRGKVKQHVPPDFSKTSLNTMEECYKWVKFYDMSAPLSALGTFVSKDPGLDLRLQHFHSFGKNEGGHYHCDTTPEDVEYLAILSTGRTLVRVDHPQSSTWFRDCDQ